ncbi:hypothetical protein OG579_16830 [Williamsia herbipolensis]|uniref:Uncharacterized protein n=1 Tax=Williamsia herbipolensis TaxID=1603258 RepID=A0AAU4JZZ2_9NOCA|nr:hypothetical protein [Williamsia herbipolensis]
MTTPAPRTTLDELLTEIDRDHSRTGTSYTEIKINEYGTTLVVYDAAPSSSYDLADEDPGEPGELIIAGTAVPGSSPDLVAARLLAELRAR